MAGDGAVRVRRGGPVTSKIETVRRAFTRIVARFVRGRLSRDQRIDNALASFRKKFPQGNFGRTLTPAEEEEILGFGPDWPPHRLKRLLKKSTSTPLPHGRGSVSA